MEGEMEPRVPAASLRALIWSGAALAGLGAPLSSWHPVVREEEEGDLGNAVKTKDEGPPMEIDSCGCLRVPLRWLGWSPRGTSPTGLGCIATVPEK